MNINTIKQLTNGKIIIAGDILNSYFGSNKSICQLNSNGSLDNTFSGLGACITDCNYPINSIVIQPDNKIIIGGKFNTYGINPAKSIARLNLNGSLDNTFISGNGISGGSSSTITKLVQFNNSKIMFIGDFNNYNSTPRNSIAQLNSNIIANVDSGTTNSGVSAIAVTNVL